MNTKTKKIRNARIIATDIFMLIAVIAIVFIMMLIAMGFSFTDNGRIEQSGLVEISSRPSSAKVTIDGKELFSTTEVNKLLRTGSHDIKITKTGYDTWNYTINIEAGLTTTIDWVRLFPLNPEIANVDTFDKTLAIASVSDSRRNILVAEDGSTTFSILNLQDEKLKEVAKIKFQDLLGELEEGATAATANDFNVIDWNGNDSRILVTHKKGESVEWIIVNTSDPTKSINITKLYNKNYSKLLFANDSATNLWALTTDGELSEINTDSTTTPVAIATNVKQMISNGDTVIYVAPSKDLVFDSYGNQTVDTKNTEKSDDEDETEETSKATDKIFVYNEGEIDSTAIADLGSIDSNVIIDTGTYWSKDWLVYNLGNKLIVRKGSYPIYNKTQDSDFAIVKEVDLKFTPSITTHNSDERIIVAANGADVYTYDVIYTTEREYQSDIELVSLNWLDDFLYWQSKDETIVVRDFNGDNRRELLSDALNDLPITISANNRYLYYFTTEEVPAIVKNTETTTNTTTDNNQEATDSSSEPTDDKALDSEKTTTMKTVYYLTREKLY